MAGHVYLCRVAGNTVWSHMASEAPWLWDGFSIKSYTRLFYHYLRHHLASRESIVTLDLCVSVCESVEPQLPAALVSAAKVMRCIQCSLSFPLAPSITTSQITLKCTNIKLPFQRASTTLPADPHVIIHDIWHLTTLASHWCCCSQ